MKAGQTYYDVSRVSSAANLAPMDARMQADLTGLPQTQYWWSDALFMGLPDWTRWATRRGDTAYLDKMDQPVHLVARRRAQSRADHVQDQDGRALRRRRGALVPRLPLHRGTGRQRQEGVLVARQRLGDRRDGRRAADPAPG
ncbi:hypothetical protein GCM10025868_05120 [Angustibacter aerolatus]|uniref:Uncharacterized protein n=1 Tax=Angustibacter aerolatus TaxID=1162965 RepID=A0ABQ6JEC9_9ACTN|nr:hypothetical protein GCM10025868_05120 [Angustibacter aerolatus]